MTVAQIIVGVLCVFLLGCLLGPRWFAGILLFLWWFFWGIVVPTAVVYVLIHFAVKYW